MENIKLENGLYLNRLYGKYMPNLTIISDKELDSDMDLMFEKEKNLNRFNCNLDCHSLFVAEGQFRKNKKGTLIFDMTKRGDILIKAKWGGSFNKTRGLGDVTEKTDGVKYFKRASSNGGGVGSNYFIVPEEWRFSIDIDDI